MADLRIGSLPGVSLPLAARPSAPAAAPGAAMGPDSFIDTLGRALERVNTQQVEAERIATDLASGRPVDMTQAVVQLEQASISLQFAIQVRNKLLEAYQDIMRMPV